MSDSMKLELVSLGFTENEAAVYVSLLELGSTNAGEVIRKTKLHRNIVYENLDKLIEKGLVSFVIIRNIKHFETTSPDELKDYIDRQKQEAMKKEETVNQILPQIQKMRSSAERKQEATIFRGKQGLKTAIEETTLAKEEVLVFGTGWGMRETMGSYYEQWHLKLKENHIKSRILLPLNKRGAFMKPFIAKYLPEESSFPSTICIFDNKVLNVVWEEDPVGILIVSDKAAQSYKQYFEVLWKLAKQ